MRLSIRTQAGKAALVAEESAVSAANLARAARTQAALGAAMLAAQAYNQVSLHSMQSPCSMCSVQTAAMHVEPVMCL